MKKIALIVVFLLIFAQCGFAQEAKKGLLLDDLEGDIVVGQTIEAESGNGSTVAVSSDKEIKHSGEQSLKIVYDAVPGGYIYAARNAAKWLQDPNDIKWVSYGALSFYVYGSNSKTKIAFDVKDADGELFRYVVADDFKGWKQIVCPFAEFSVRGDWQPADADKNAMLDFPVKGFQFEPLAVAKGTIYIDGVILETMN